MSDLLNRYGRLLVFPAAAVVFFLGALLFFYRGTYDPPPSGEIPAHRILPPASSFTALAETPPIHRGTLLVDAGHNNDYQREEITSFLARVSERGYEIDFLGASGTFGSFGTFGGSSLDSGNKLERLQEKLRGADSFLVIQPVADYTPEEAGEIRRFVLDDGGKLLLVADPTRNHNIDSLADGFGINFRPDYLYNLVEYDLNFQNVFVSDFRPDEITSGLGRIALYTVGSLESSGPGLAVSDANTQSTVAGNTERFYPIVKSPDGGVVAIGDMTFMVPPQNKIFDNPKLISNLANFLTQGQREFHLDDFPHFFRDDVDIILSGPALVDAGAQMNDLLDGLQVVSEIKALEDLDQDSVYLGLYEDAVNVAQYLQLAGVQIGDTVRTPFAADIAPDDTAVAILHQGPGRQVLVILGDTPDSLASILDQLTSGDFRDGLIGDSIGVYKTS